VFNMFSQVTAAQERSEGGLGIGLALTRGLVQLHGGNIEAHSDGAGKGATFTARLPIVCASGVAGEAQGERVAATHPQGIRRRIVIADDNRDAAESLAVLMRLEGHEVRLAHDGRAARDLIDGFRPDAALLDIGMPGLTGYELARHVREQPQLQGMRLIAITGWGQTADKARALSEGFDVHMTKPVEVSRLVELLQDHDRDETLYRA
jgi:CheY-like chemotaxis protein